MYQSLLGAEWLLLDPRSWSSVRTWSRLGVRAWRCPVAQGAPPVTVRVGPSLNACQAESQPQQFQQEERCALGLLGESWGHAVGSSKGCRWWSWGISGCWLIKGNGRWFFSMWKQRVFRLFLMRTKNLCCAGSMFSYKEGFCFSGFSSNFFCSFKKIK